MKIRNKILIYFFTTVILLSAFAMVVIYLLFAEYREEEFQQRQNEKIKITIRLLAEYKEKSEELTQLLDELTIHDFYDEKMLIFNRYKELVYSSVDDLQIENYADILNQLSPANQWIETKEGVYDLIGIYLEHNNTHFYAISKAYDAFGYSKMYFLRNVLVMIFIVNIIIVLLVSFIISNKISTPITALADTLNHYDPGGKNRPQIETETSSHELKYLTMRFNELLRRNEEAFLFQKHAIHHISHQLKTPVAVMVLELEKLKEHPDIGNLKSVVENQLVKSKSLGSIINVLLEISKIESGQHIPLSAVRIDELIFDLMQELNVLYPDFNFEVNYEPATPDENKLIFMANEMLIRQAFQNLLSNCIAYSDNAKAQILIDCRHQTYLKISISNPGLTLSDKEQVSLFTRFFRGKNSNGKIGFGLGLMLTKKILDFHNGEITYQAAASNLNIFEIILPLS